jgi:AsmA-like C-terminal region
VQSLIELLQRAKKDLPSDVIGKGTLNGDVRINTRTSAEGSQLAWEGSGEAVAIRLRSEITRADLSIARIPFQLSSPTEAQRNPFRRPRNADAASKESHIDVGPFPLTAGKLPSPVVHGILARSGYHIWIQGEGQVQRLLQIAQTTGLHGPQPVADGAAKLDLHIMGEWAGFAPPKILGVAQLHSVRTEVRGINGPVEISSADVHVTDEDVRVANLVAATGTMHWSGSMVFPRQCRSLETCPIQFELSSDVISSEAVNNRFNPNARKQPWYRFLSTGSQASVFTSLNASGRLSASRVTLGPVVANRVSAAVELKDGNIRVSDLRGDVLGGKYQGDWQADFRKSPPVYGGSGRFDHIDLTQVAEIMHNRWVTGFASGSYRLSSVGSGLGDLIASASGVLHVEAQEGTLPHLMLTTAATPVRMRHFTGQLEIHDRLIEFQESKLETPSTTYQVSGTASFGQQLDIRLSRTGSRGFNITGTLAEPQVIEGTPSETQAALKP